AFGSGSGAMASAIELLASAQIQVEEAVGELNRFIDHFDADPERQQQVEERLDSIYTLARKHRVQPSELGELQQRLLEELEGLNADDQAQERLGEELAAYARHYQEKAEELSAKRRKAAEKLGKAVEAEMQRLGMPGGRFQIELRATGGDEPHPAGLELVEFLVSANPGQPLRALAKVASGGELSRISLAIQGITAQTSRVPTRGFDEVGLGIAGGRFPAGPRATGGDEPHPAGVELVEFLASATPGQPLRALAKVASGGELSRISLAIQVITAQTSRVPTLVFDEVDVGIGGPTAEVVGQLLRRLGERGQVLCVTHLPQVAAQGHHHLFVHKKRGRSDTSTAVAHLDQQQRIEEVARMLGGVDLTDESLAHAAKMLASAPA